MGITYIDGDWVDDADATVNVRSRALNYGLGCFAGIRGYLADDGEQVYVFRLDRHIHRLGYQAKILHLKLPDPAVVRDVLLELLRRNEAHYDVYMRPLLLHNSNELAPILDPSTTSFIAYTMPLSRYLSDDPINVCVSSWRRSSDNAVPARAKPTGGYVNSALARQEALDNGFDEAIMLTDAGKVSEGSAEHIFLVRDGVLFSPPSTEDNLDGITRQSLISLATQDLGLEFVERPIGRTELYSADEIFLCGTGAEVTPVASVDRRNVGDGSIGATTKLIRQHYDDVTHGRVEHRMEWLTPVW
ncbi:MAG: branched-chain amino acid transaminase [Acidobacteria bacterium]|nr:branched-chain amino acid transaminase [Acidobacteriota bacterium]MCH8985951.1 branched-chain amino acid transaminase [Acidobacteriota bacterium]